MSGARVAIVGLGLMGQLHADHVVELGHDIVAGVDVDADSRDSFAAAYDVPTYENVPALLEAEALDAAFVTTPNRHHDAALPLLDADKSVLVEKPLAADLETATTIAAAADRSGGACMVGFHNRFAAATRLVKAQSEAGRLGEPTHVEADYLRRRGVPGTGSWFTDPELAGGGALLDIGVHLVDLVLYLLGFPTIVEVSGATRSTFGPRTDYADPEGFGGNWTGDGDFEVEDGASAFLRTADGTTMSVDVAWAANGPPSKEVLIRGTAAGARFEIGGEEVTLFEAGTAGGDHYATTTLEASVEESGHRAQDKRFLDAVVAGEQPAISTVGEALAVQQVLDAVYRSAAAGQAVGMDANDWPVGD